MGDLTRRRAEDGVLLRGVQIHSVEYQLTLHGEKADAPWRKVLYSTERKPTLHGAFFVAYQSRSFRFLSPPLEGEGLGVGLLSRKLAEGDRPHPYPLPSKGRGKAAEHLY